MIRLIHLSDIHFESDKSLLLKKTELVVKSITVDMPQTTQAVLLVFNGDYAAKGAKTGFDVAEQFVRELLAMIKKAIPANVPIYTVMTPGNHDCDFSSDQTARDVLLKNLKPSRPQVSVEQLILLPLESYFALADRLDEHFSASISRNNPYFDSFRLDTEDGSLEVYLINSAWMSQRHEKANQSAFPLKELPVSGSSDADAAVAIMHHPLNWFRQPDTMTQLGDWVCKSCDLLITGHEHTPKESIVESETAISHCAGGALQESDSSHSSCFQIVDLDLSSHLGVSTRREYQDSHYAITATKELRLSNSATEIQPRRLAVKHRAWLEDPMLPIQVPNRTQIKLQQFYLYPDLDEYSDTSSTHGTENILAARVFDVVSGEYRSLLTGADRCGKTAFARQFYLDLHSRGLCQFTWMRRSLAAD